MHTAPVLDALLFEGERSGVRATRSGEKADNQFESAPDLGRNAYQLASQDAALAGGSVVIGVLWLALYVVAVLHALTPVR
jgi:hypothetical protein